MDMRHALGITLWIVVAVLLTVHMLLRARVNRILKEKYPAHPQPQGWWKRRSLPDDDEVRSYNRIAEIAKWFAVAATIAAEAFISLPSWVLF